MEFEPAGLEDWMREFYFATDIDIGSSGVTELSLGQLRAALDITVAELDAVALRDSTSWGGDGLRLALANRWGNGNPEWVMATHGASEAIYLVLNTLLNPGEEILALDPIYHSLVSTARTIGCSVRPWRLRPEADFAPDLAAAAALVGPNTRMIVVNFPHNPTGVTLTPQQQAELIDLAASVDAYLLWDNAFADLVYDAAPLPEPTARYAKAISVGTLSKGYGLPGLRFGWCIAEPELLDRIVRLRDRMTLHLSPLVEFLAQRVAEDADRLLTGRLATATANRAMLIDWAREHSELVELPVPAGGVTGFPRFPTVPDTEPLCRVLATEHRTLLVPGVCFDHCDRVRLGFGGTSTETATGLDLLAKTLRSW